MQSNSLVYYMFYDTPAGRVLFTANATTLTGVYWEAFKRTPTPTDTWVKDPSKFVDVIQQLKEYFAGSRKLFTIPYLLEGTDFQRSVWKELEKLAYGEISSYKKLAEAIGNPKAVRAVGTAVGSNPLSLLVPCHRVLTTAHTLGGYAGGIESKKRLLAIENIAWQE